MILMYENSSMFNVLFWRIMPLAMENLAIAQHSYMLCYAIICGSGYWPLIHKFELKVMYISNK
jgi:hypothetical protein